MFKHRLRLPSPALVISLIALSLALGGTAIAAGTAVYLTKASGTRLVRHLAPTLSVKNANTVGGKQVKQFFVKETSSTSATTLLSVDGITLKGACDPIVDPYLTVENDSGQNAMLGGYSSSGGGQNLTVTHLTTTPVDLTGGSNGGGTLTAMLGNYKSVTIQFAGTGTLGSDLSGCYFSGTVIAS
jgi:hypothetical protein